MSPWILASRPKTLPAAIAPVLIGSALAWRDGDFDLLPASAAMLFALLIQIGTNFANDYYDFVKGADTAERIGPTRAVAAGLVTPRAMALATGITFALAIAVGLTLVPYGGWWLVGVGVASVLCGIAYTGGPYPLGYNGWGDVFVFIFFGLVAVSLTYYVQAGAFLPESLIAGAAPGALATNILAVNNYRDYATDLKAGKRTIVVRLGRASGLWEYALMLAIAHAACVALALLSHSLWPLLPLLLLPLPLKILTALPKARTAADFGKALAATAGYMMAFSLLFAGGLLKG